MPNHQDRFLRIDPPQGLGFTADTEAFEKYLLEITGRDAEHKSDGNIGSPLSTQQSEPHPPKSLESSSGSFSALSPSTLSLDSLTNSKPRSKRPRSSANLENFTEIENWLKQQSKLNCGWEKLEQERRQFQLWVTEKEAHLAERESQLKAREAILVRQYQQLGLHDSSFEPPNS